MCGGSFAFGGCLEEWSAARACGAQGRLYLGDHDDSNIGELAAFNRGRDGLVDARPHRHQAEETQLFLLIRESIDRTKEDVR